MENGGVPLINYGRRQAAKSQPFSTASSGIHVSTFSKEIFQLVSVHICRTGIKVKNMGVWRPSVGGHNFISRPRMEIVKNIWAGRVVWMRGALGW